MMSVTSLFVFFILLTWHHAHAHIPMRYYDWAEPDRPVILIETQQIILNRQNSEARLTALRSVMAARGVTAYIIPTADAHNSQYIAPSDARREWISGFTGSAGTALVTLNEALLFTDGRYFTQFELEVNATHWQLMRQGTDLTVQGWLLANLDANSIVGVDPTTYTRNAWTPLQAALAQNNVTLEAIPGNLVDIARENYGEPAPARPNEGLLALSVDFTGRQAGDKIAELAAQMAARNAAALILTALDDVAYTLNLRGSDIPYNPVFFAYLIIRIDQVDSSSNVTLFWGNGTLALEIQQHLTDEGVNLTAMPYDDVFDYVAELSSYLSNEYTGDNSIIWLSQDGSHAIHSAAETGVSTRTISSVSPVSLMKCVKNEIELLGFRSAHIKDGIAVVRMLRWVHEQVASGVIVTEIDVSNKLIELRSEEADFMGPSFATIAGAGENGAIIHYKPPDVGSRVIGTDDMLLVDSGAQYKDGTTDITRTRHMSASPTEAQRRAFTRVLKGQILLGTAVFPRGSTGNVLETLARKALWDVGLNYAHGTGHGVGHFLNVHEGPSGIGASLIATDPGIVPGMIFSDEPGYYEVGEYGIRHEDLVEVIEINNQADHILAEGMVGDFNGVGAVGFYTISLAPHQTACLDINILNDFELKYINDYHARVLATLGPILQERGLTDDYDWLERECAPILRSAAILVYSTPLLIIASVFCVLSY